MVTGPIAETPLHFRIKNRFPEGTPLNLPWKISAFSLFPNGTGLACML
jgi:hypothetical protein